MHRDVTFMLQDLIPDITSPYADDIPVKGPKTRYEMGSGGYEVLAENPGVRRFFWEHMQNMHKVVQMIKVYGGMLSAKKSIICAPEAELLGYWLTYEGRRPDPKRMQRIMDWPVPTCLTEVRAFLGTMGFVRIFILFLDCSAADPTHSKRSSV